MVNPMYHVVTAEFVNKIVNCEWMENEIVWELPYDEALAGMVLTNGTHTYFVEYDMLELLDAIPEPE